ncbi:HAD family hydrolase [Nesterenkonia flava]|uniref:HAD family hydrolase n=1 Tax=Nesterenkonia flava TaxID=469799 RepID=A0ABU1FTF3_9MICC|nr:HAD family hydrolase [Nesterenkonia flava]MDR5711940.1 hypothetical protein [Nesterenkonia flava]
MRDKLLLLDFDGTVCLGEDPILAYAAEVDHALAHRGLAHQLPAPVVEIVTEALHTDQLLVEAITYDDDGVPTAVSGASEPTDSSEAGTSRAHPVSWPLQDGYQLTQLLARQAGLTDEEAGAAYRAGRHAIVARGLGATDLHAPEGLQALLDQVRESAVVVLITNAPGEAFDPWLKTLGLTTAFDAVINGARKPLGMPAAVEQARAVGVQNMDEATMTPATRILSVGDIWANDLQPVAEIGGETILLDRFSTGLGQPTRRVKDFAEAAPLIAHWASSSDARL